MQNFLEHLMSEAGIAALLGAVFGAVAVGASNYLLERRREKSRLKLDLLLVRREVELKGLEAAHQLADHFKIFFLHNYQDYDEEADEAQAQAMLDLSDWADELKIIALQVDVLASRKVAQLLQRIPDRIFEYFDEAQADQKIYANKANVALEDIHVIMELLKSVVRTDVQTRLIDSRLERRSRPR